MLDDGGVVAVLGPRDEDLWKKTDEVAEGPKALLLLNRSRSRLMRSGRQVETK